MQVDCRPDVEWVRYDETTRLMQLVKSLDRGHLSISIGHNSNMLLLTARTAKCQSPAALSMFSVIRGLFFALDKTIHESTRNSRRIRRGGLAQSWRQINLLSAIINT